MEIFPRDGIFNHGATVTLSCTAEGGSDNVFLWLSNETLIAVGNELTLMFINATAGGQYTCVVSNGAGDGSETTNVFVRPMITHSPYSKETTNGLMVMLMCEAQAFPKPQYEWIHSTEGGDAVVSIGSNLLVLCPMLFGDEGEYYCRAMSSNITVESDRAIVTGRSMAWCFNPLLC